MWQLPAACVGRRSCIDDKGRWWVDGKPFLPRGVYNGGYDYLKLLDNCPSGQACESTTPTDAADYVARLADAGFNLIMDRSRYLPADLLAAIHGEPTMKIAHLLWSDPFEKEGREAMLADIQAAAADNDVVMWFGPDEVDLNINWAQAAGIRRLLRGASPALDELLTKPFFKPQGEAVLPPDEPAHDPHGLPFSAALAFDHGLQQGHLIYDLLMPITYPFNHASSNASEGMWGTWRVDADWGPKLPVMPVLQMVGIPSMNLAQPTPGQIEAQVMSSLVRGKVGSFYFTLIGDEPKMQGRDGWWAQDDPAAWQAFKERHAVEDRLLLALFSFDTSTSGQEQGLTWRWLKRGDRSLFVLVNPGATPLQVDLHSIVQLGPGQRVREYLDCKPTSQPKRVVDPYTSLLLEVLPE